jgi:hypothetical protein
VKKFLLATFCLINFFAKAQKVDSIYINLYTDSLKKGTYNYINVDGLMSNGKYIPLDSTHLFFTASYATFKGNSLFIPWDFTAPKVTIKVSLRANPAVYKQFDMWIKTVDNTGNLKTADEILNDMQKQSPAKKKKKKGIFG